MNKWKEIKLPDASAFSNMNENTYRNGGIENGARRTNIQAYGIFISNKAIKMMTHSPRIKPKITSLT